MARKRFIKPEFFQDVDLSEVSIEARYLFSGMWPWMDRQGVIDADARVHRANVFPHDEKITVQKVQGWLNELVAAGFVRRFSWQGKDLLFCPTFNKHQRIWPDEKSLFNVSDELLASLNSNAALPAQSCNSTVTVLSQSGTGTVPVPDKEKEEEKDKREGGVGETKLTLVLDFESLYKTYPRKKGKDEGMNRLRARIKSQADFDAFAKAVKNYIAECVLEGTGPKFMKHWSTFVGTDGKEPWRDYVDWAAPVGAQGSLDDLAELRAKYGQKGIGA